MKVFAISCVLLLACGRHEQEEDLPDSACVSCTAEVRRDIPYASIAGVDPSLLSLDAYLPGGGGTSRPIVIWVHGGGWAIGDKANNVDNKVALFNGAGWVFVSINYRLSPNPPTSDPNRVKYPDHPTDVAAALAWVRAHAADLHGDPTRIAILGHSAGAHLAALVSTDEQFAGALSAIRCTGSLDTEAYDIPKAFTTASAQQVQIYDNAFGSDQSVWPTASPAYHVAAGKHVPPFVVAVRGDASRQAIEHAFAQTLNNAGITATEIDARSLTHEQVNERIGAAGDTIMTPPLMAFLTACFQN